MCIIKNINKKKINLILVFAPVLCYTVKLLQCSLFAKIPCVFLHVNVKLVIAQ